MRNSFPEESGAAFDQLFQFSRCANQHVQREATMREQVRDGAVPFKDAAIGECIGHDQQIYIAIRLGLTVSARAKQDDCLRVKG